MFLTLKACFDDNNLFIGGLRAVEELGKIGPEADDTAFVEDENGDRIVDVSDVVRRFPISDSELIWPQTLTVNDGAIEVLRLHPHSGEIGTCILFAPRGRTFLLGPDGATIDRI